MQLYKLVLVYMKQECIRHSVQATDAAWCRKGCGGKVYREAEKANVFSSVRHRYRWTYNLQFSPKLDKKSSLVCLWQSLFGLLKDGHAATTDYGGERHKDEEDLYNLYVRYTVI